MASVRSDCPLPINTDLGPDRKQDWNRPDRLQTADRPVVLKLRFVNPSGARHALSER